MNEKNYDLGHKGYYFEQTAEFAEFLGEQVTRERCYQEAIEAYKAGGWIEEALKVARKIKYSKQIKDLEKRLI